ncbi:MAG: T9SS type A sorting domain-containing protein [Candidatus Cloacimonetes bacterium]|nr:T9SS type A sorting domain-containing protein [Candidatus Cloacimonadota bacterium]
MKYLSSIVLLFYMPVLLYCNLLEVDLNGSGDFLTIQAGITEAVDDDTILVFPGEYFENVNYSGKTIVIGSLYLVTEERTYIRSTIINGNQENSCVIVLNGEEEGTKLSGFTLTNGSGWTGPNFAAETGGGVIIFESSLIIDNCIIEGNSTVQGGGINLNTGSNVYLKGCTIRNNRASFFGGGIALLNDNSEVTFDEEDRCNIYNNYAGMGNDICSRYLEGTVSVIVDTLTSFDYWGYRVIQFWYGDPLITDEGFEIEMEHSWLTPIESDLFVAPWGSNENSGLSQNDPLKSISWAMQQIASNEIDPHAIHLADGVYSPGVTEEYFPIQMKGWVTLIGESSEATILDGEHQTNITYNYYLDGDIRFENLRFINSGTNNSSGASNHVIRIGWNFDSEVFLENIVFENNQPASHLILFETDSNIYMNNITAIGNGEDSKTVIMLSACNDDEPIEIVMNNFILRNNNNCIFMLIGKYTYPSFYFNNLLMSNNHKQYETPGIYNYTSLGLSLWQNVYLTNCTIANNENEVPSPSGVIQLGSGANLAITNCIVYDNNTDYLVLDYNFSDTELNIENSLFDFTESEIKSNGPTTLNYDTETIFSGNPMFVGQGEYPQTLMSYSPCIDAGTLDLPENVILPETDVFGNPRIFGNGVDIGAIEWQGTPIDFDEIVQKPSEMMVYPNPIIPGIMRDGKAMIEWRGEDISGDASLEIFNVKGQCVRKLKMENGKLKIKTTEWDLTDNSGSRVSSGVYFIRMKADGEYKAQCKVILCN